MMHTRGFCTYLVLLFNLALFGGDGGAYATKNVNRKQYRSIKSYMDHSADPCDDFYQHACGNWKNVHAGANYYETIGFVDHNVNKEYARILKSVRRNNKAWEFKFVRNLYNYHRSCLELDEYKPEVYLRWLERRENISWPEPLPYPHKNSEVHSDFDWLHLLAVLRRYDFNGVFLEQTVLQQHDDGRRSIIDIDKPILNGGFKPMTAKGFALIMEYLGETSSKKRRELWEDVELFEVKLQSLDDIEDDVGYQQSTLEALNMTWLERYLSVVMEQTLPRVMIISVQNIPYMQQLYEVLDSYESEFIYRYLMIRFLAFLNESGPSNFYKMDCVEHMRSQLPLAMNWLYERYNSRLVAETPHIEQLFQTLLQHFRQQLEKNSNNLNATVLNFLHDKMATMQIKVGNLPRLSTEEQLEDFYKELYSITSDDFYLNHLQILRFNTLAREKRLQTLLPRNAAEFFHLEDTETGVSSSPYYLLRAHIVIVPLTLLHLPIYHSDLSPLFKFSSLGFLLAHELMHSADYSGIDVDQNGNMRGPADEIKANRRFDEQLNCLRSNQPDIVDEKIADVSGLRWAYESFFQNASISKQRQLFYSEYSTKRLFFLNFAQFFCSNLDMVDMMDFSEHGSDRQRVLDALANFEEFGRVYKCPVGSAMHPARKCQLW